MTEKFRAPSWDSVWNAPMDPTTPETEADIKAWRAQFESDSTTAKWQRINEWQSSPDAYKAFKKWEAQNTAQSAKDARAQEAKVHQDFLTEKNVKNIGR